MQILVVIIINASILKTRLFNNLTTLSTCAFFSESADISFKFFLINLLINLSIKIGSDPLVLNLLAVMNQAREKNVEIKPKKKYTDTNGKYSDCTGKSLDTRKE